MLCVQTNSQGSLCSVRLHTLFTPGTRDAIGAGKECVHASCRRQGQHPRRNPRCASARRVVTVLGPSHARPVPMRAHVRLLLCANSTLNTCVQPPRPAIHLLPHSPPQLTHSSIPQLTHSPYSFYLPLFPHLPTFPREQLVCPQLQPWALQAAIATALAPILQALAVTGQGVPAQAQALP
jgi:hypothetical protein